MMLKDISERHYYTGHNDHMFQMNQSLLHQHFCVLCFFIYCISNVCTNCYL